MKKIVVTLVASVALLAAAVPAFAQSAQFEFKTGFRTIAQLVPDVVGQPIEEETANANGDTHQTTTSGVMVWRKADNTPAFTDGKNVWQLGPSGLEVRDDAAAMASLSDDIVNGVKLRGDGTVDDNLPRHSGMDDAADDNLPQHSGLDDMVNGVKVRGDGTVDDNLPRHSGADDSVGGVDLRGDGTVEDSGPSGRDRERSSDDGGSSGRGR